MAHSSINFNNLPDNVICTIASYLPLREMTEVMKIHQRFRNVCKLDSNLWRSHLVYPKKYYLGDCNDQSNHPRIGYIVNRILQEIISRGYGYFRLQHCHLENLLNNHTLVFNTIQADDFQVESLRSVSYMAEAVHDSGQHWLFFCLDNRIVVWDMTSLPRMLHHQLFDIGAYSGTIKIFPRGILVNDCTSTNNGLRAVYHFNEQPLNLDFRFKFVYHMDTPLALNIQPPEEFNYGFCEIILGDLYIAWNSTVHPLINCVLHVWDLSSSNKLARINLADYEEVSEQFVSFITSNGGGQCDLGRACTLRIYPGEFSSVIVVLKCTFDQEILSQINILNVTTGRLTHSVAQIRNDVLVCSMYSNHICVEKRTRSESFASVYTLHSNNGVAEPEPLISLNCPVSENPQHNENILFKKNRVLVKQDNEVRVLNLKEPITQLRCTIRPNLEMLGFLEPSLLLVYDTFQNPTDTALTVIDISNSREVVTWQNVNIGTRFKDYFQNLEYPSKLVFKLREEFRILKF
uniref:F-box domain-containing protein n=1 Tax=Cuerna arida TaxID=1464854 RepID=A0A1B6EL96_9HEMI